MRINLYGDDYYDEAIMDARYSYCVLTALTLVLCPFLIWWAAVMIFKSLVISVGLPIVLALLVWWLAVMYNNRKISRAQQKCKRLAQEEVALNQLLGGEGIDGPTLLPLISSDPDYFGPIKMLPVKTRRQPRKGLSESTALVYVDGSPIKPGETHPKRFPYHWTILNWIRSQLLNSRQVRVRLVECRAETVKYYLPYSASVEEMEVMSYLRLETNTGHHLEVKGEEFEPDPDVADAEDAAKNGQKQR